MYTVKAFNAYITRFCVLSWSVILLSHLPPELIHITVFRRSNVTISLGSGYDPISFKFSTGHWGWGESPGISEVLAIVYSYHRVLQQTSVLLCQAISCSVGSRPACNISEIKSVGKFFHVYWIELESVITYYVVLREHHGKRKYI